MISWEDKPLPRVRPGYQILHSMASTTRVPQNHQLTALVGEEQRDGLLT